MRLAAFAFASAATLTVHSGHAQSTPARAARLQEDGIFARGATLERVFNGGFFLEGPAQGPDGRIYVSDITQSWRTGMAAGNIWVFDPRDRTTSIFRSPSGMSNGLVFDHAGRLIAAHGADFGGRYVSRTDLATGKSKILAGLYRERPFNSPNDVTTDDAGRIYFTDPRYFGHEPVEQPVFGVYRIDPDGTVTLLIADAARPNGIAVSSDGKRLYVTEADFLLSDRRIEADVAVRWSGASILRYDLSPAGKPSGRRVLVEYAAEGGGSADGIEVDYAGNIFAAVQTSRPGIRVYSPDGKQIAEVAMSERPTNLTLAEHGGRGWLYVTAGKNLYRIRTAASRARQLARVPSR